MKDLTWLKQNLIAHRGLHSKDLSVPENSICAFRKAIELGYSIECDLNMTKDQEIVVIHDFHLKRLTGLDKNISDVTLAELNTLFINQTSEKIPTLKSLLSLVNGQVPLLIEIKTHGHLKTFLNHFMDIMKSYRGLFAVFSFNPMVVYWFKKNYPDIIRGQISDYFLNDSLNKFIKYLLSSMAFNIFTKPDFISYHLQDIPNKYVDKSYKKELCVISFVAQNQDEFDFVKKHYDNVVFEYFNPKI